MDIPLPPSPPRPASPVKPSAPVEYSPSPVTMSDDDDLEPQVIVQKIKNNESSKKVETAGEVSKAVSPLKAISPPKAISIDLKRNPKVLGVNRAAQLLHAFKTTKAGPISLDLAKATSRAKISKLKNFDDDENEQV